MKPRIVIDTNVIITALKSSKGASNKLLQFFGTDKFVSHISVALIIEYEAVIKRLLPNLRVQEINYLLDYICATSKHTKIYYLWRPCLKNPKDDMVLELAVAAEADFIVTYNLRDFKLAKKYGIKAATSKEILMLLGEVS
jgi:putative PIN family toxin of toxin-antitoxin system